MSCPSRPPKRSDGSSAVRGGDSPDVSAAGATSQIDCSAHEGSELSPGNSGCTGAGQEPVSPSPYGVKVISSHDRLNSFQMRSIFRVRRPSSGYFSYESEPGSPLSPRPVTADKATQTPSLTAQVMIHALKRTTEARGEGARAHRQHGRGSARPCSIRPQNAAGAMQAESVGQGLRRIGDEYNRLLIERPLDRKASVSISKRLDAEHAIHPQQLPLLHQEPTFLICMGLMLLLIGRVLYLQSSTSSHQGHSQV